MTTLLDRATGPRPNERRDGRQQPAFRIPVDRSRRRPLLAVVSALAVFTSVAVFAFLYRSADRRMPVLVVIRAVQQGQRFTTSDLGETAVVPGPGVATVPIDRADAVLGRTASVTLTPGSLLTPDDVSSGPPVPAGEALVGVALKQGQMPAGGLSPGDHVMVVETASPGSAITTFLGPAPSGSASATGSGTQGAVASSSGAVGTGTSSSPTGVLVPDSIVFETSVPGQQSSDVSELVSLEVDADLAPAVSAAAAAGQVSLAFLPASETSSAVAPPTPANRGSGGAGRPRSRGSSRGTAAVRARRLNRVAPTAST